MQRWGVVAAVVAALFMAAGCGGEDDVVVPEREAYRQWLKVELPGTVCGDGSQYKFFVNYSDVSNNVVVAFEPGGACWDFESCTGQAGIRGAANVDGLDDNHWELAPFIIPLFNREFEGNETRDWNMVYIPYCTGDVHTGNNVITYSDPEGMLADVEFHHAGHNNMMAVVDWMAQNFEKVPKFLMSGCSAGGVGSTVNYYFMRQGMPGIENGYLLADSGPLMPTPGGQGFSRPLHEKVFDSWDVPSILSTLPNTFDTQNFGSVNDVLAQEYPEDRLAVTFFRRDFNFSLYSYERFYDFPPKNELLDMWWADTQVLMSTLDGYDNFGYYIPYWRAINDSHCTTVIDYIGSEIPEAGVDMYDYIDMLLGDGPIESYVESVQPGEDGE